MESDVIINRAWSMPNRNTFKIKPIRKLLDCYVNGGIVIDPFANNSTYGTITNDINPEFKTNYNLDALSFLNVVDDNTADIVLFDPPYSFRQATECYKKHGTDLLKQSVTNMGYWSKCKDRVALILKPQGICIFFGWGTNAIGKNRGLEIIEILIVAHGANKNDTLVTVERKIK